MIKLLLKLTLAFGIISCGGAKEDEGSSEVKFYNKTYTFTNQDNYFHITSIYIYRTTGPGRGSDQAFGGILRPGNTWYNLVGSYMLKHCMAYVDIEGYDVVNGNTYNVNWNRMPVNLCNGSRLYFDRYNKIQIGG